VQAESAQAGDLQQPAAAEKAVRIADIARSLVGGHGDLAASEQRT
jgi:hypothetical protein